MLLSSKVIGRPMIEADNVWGHTGIKVLGHTRIKVLGHTRIKVLGHTSPRNVPWNVPVTKLAFVNGLKRRRTALFF